MQELPARGATAMVWSRSRGQLACVVLAVCGLLAGGCAQCGQCRLPRIDPTGEHCFVMPPPAPPKPPPAPKYHQEPSLHAKHHANTGVRLTPARVIAPIGSEVVMTAAVCGACGKDKAHEQVEWSLAQGGIGQFLGVGKKAGFDWLLSCHQPRKV